MRIEERHGFAGVRRARGGLGGHLGAPHVGKIAIALLAATFAAAGLPALVGADEAKTPVNPLSLINVLTKPVEDRQTAYDESVKREGPAPRSALGGELQPDGSVRYGSMTVTVKNPCPPGTVHYEPPPLPGRRARN